MATRVTPYGLKEVADLYFFPAMSSTGDTIAVSLDTGTGKMSVTYTNASSSVVEPKFIFDTLKVSNIEISAEEANATGGKGNAELISWSYGKEITLTIEDAVFNLSTIDLLFGSTTGTADDNTDEQTIKITPETFPGYYTMVGTTFIRNKDTGADEGFYFVIGKGKVNLGGTLTMEADGDPSTFEMSIKALKDINGNLITFTKLGTSVGGNAIYDQNTDAS